MKMNQNQTIVTFFIAYVLPFHTSTLVLTAANLRECENKISASNYFNIFSFPITVNGSSHEKLYTWFSSSLLKLHIYQASKIHLLYSLFTQSLLKAMKIHRMYSICSLTSSQWNTSPFDASHVQICYWRLSFFSICVEPCSLQEVRILW